MCSNYVTLGYSNKTTQELSLSHSQFHTMRGFIALLPALLAGVLAAPFPSAGSAIQANHGLEMRHLIFPLEPRRQTLRIFGTMNKSERAVGGKGTGNELGKRADEVDEKAEIKKKDEVNQGNSDRVKGPETQGSDKEKTLDEEGRSKEKVSGQDESGKESDSAKLKPDSTERPIPDVKNSGHLVQVDKMEGEDEFKKVETPEDTEEKKPEETAEKTKVTAEKLKITVEKPKGMMHKPKGTAEKTEELFEEYIKALKAYQKADTKQQPESSDLPKGTAKKPQAQTKKTKEELLEEKEKALNAYERALKRQQPANYVTVDEEWLKKHIKPENKQIGHPTGEVQEERPFVVKGFGRPEKEEPNLDDENKRFLQFVKAVDEASDLLR
ncbi:hypothetical protein EDB81DRAFT_470536 [Dactylonectria macrodidyma]|uniref:Uncharacterized protein n=1 Tax=Dactylonectria macrodidyma TaxID=307937 RepID=A0A9P9EYW8_9HYPO|nr:hypothetical protein EDB81DRAFT_470536 [Dactylonectria macrodidyma]